MVGFCIWSLVFLLFSLYNYTEYTDVYLVTNLPLDACYDPIIAGRCVCVCGGGGGGGGGAHFANISG